MRFATFNIGSGRTSDGTFDVARLTEAVVALDADVLSLQEVDRDQERSEHVDLTEVVAAAMGARHRVFAPTLYGVPGGSWTAAGDELRDGPAYGCALISRYPLSDVHLFRIPAAPLALPLWVPGAGVLVVREEPRVAVVAHAAVGTGAGPTVVATHLPFVPLWNHWQLRRVVADVASRPGPLLLMGDLNLPGKMPARVTGYRSLVRAPTFPAAQPRFQLDHLLFRGRLEEFGSVTATSTPAVSVSDHRPLVVDLDVI